MPHSHVGHSPTGTLSLFEVQNAELAYQIASWTSWVLPLLVFEVWCRWE